MEKDTKDQRESDSEQTRRAFIRTNLGRVVAGAVGFSLAGLAENASGRICHGDSPHSDVPEHHNGPDPEAPGYSDHAHYDEPHGDNPTAHSDDTGRHNDIITHSNTGHKNYTDNCVHTDNVSHGNQVHSDQYLHLDNCG
jgi:hypothetical protein